MSIFVSDVASFWPCSKAFEICPHQTTGFQKLKANDVYRQQLNPKVEASCFLVTCLLVALQKIYWFMNFFCSV